MKRVLLTTMGVAALGMASYAATFMEVKTKDGNVVKFDVESVNQVVFEDSTPVDTTPISNHPYVDLGLPSGTLWATYNIGATKPEEYGDYFAWGETEPKEVYDWSTYKWAKYNEEWNEYYLDSITKYNMSEKYGKSTACLCFYPRTTLRQPTGAQSGGCLRTMSRESFMKTATWCGRTATMARTLVA